MLLFKKGKKQKNSMLQTKAFSQMFWAVKVARSYFKRKRLSVSPAVAQANHTSGVTWLRLLQPCCV